MPERIATGVSGPKPGSTACSGCGIRPTTLPRSFRRPAMSFTEPFGLPPMYLKATKPSPSRRFRVSASAMYPPSPFLSGIVISWFSSNWLVHAVSTFSTRRPWSRQIKCWCSLRINMVLLLVGKLVHVSVEH